MNKWQQWSEDKKQVAFFRLCLHNHLPNQNALDKIAQMAPFLKTLDYQYHENNPLMCAVYHNDYDLIKLLLNLGANLNYSIDTNNNTLSHVREVKMLDYLIDKGLNIYLNECSDESALFYLLQEGELEIVKKLINLGVQYQHLDYMNLYKTGRDAFIEYITLHEANKEKEQLELNLTKKQKVKHLTLKI